MQKNITDREKRALEEALKDPFKDSSFYHEIVAMVTSEYERRKKEKNFLEVQWQLNFDFLEGRQYAVADFQKSETIETDALFDGQERSVYNEIAPISETRRAKLRQLNKFMTVISSTSENDDIRNAEVSTEILKNTYNGLEFDDKLVTSVDWSETCGTVFLKNSWNNNKGEYIGEYEGVPMYSGEINADVISPFEIFPESLSKQTLHEQTSLIHAKVFSRDDLFLKYGIEIAGSDNSVYTVSHISNTTGGFDYESGEIVSLNKENMQDSAVVLEYYERPNRFYPEGRLIIVCEDRLIEYKKSLPYQNAANGQREFPFVKIDCISRINSFFGLSVIERLIPIQREYNAVHNRINEYLKRTTIGIPVIEKDSLANEEEIEETGFMPGVPIYYERGYNPPRFMETPTLPATYMNKLQELKQDFIVISGVSEIARNSSTPGAVTSGVGIQLLQQQDDTRIALSGKNIISAIKQCGRQWLYLYKQFATTDRVVRCTGMSLAICRKWNRDNLTSFDILVADDSNMFSNSALTRELANQLYTQGFFQDRYAKVAYLSLLKNGDINKACQEELLDIKNAEKENYMFQEENKIPVLREEDDHELHLKQHNILRKSDWYRDVLCKENGLPVLAKKFNEHCEAHKQYITKQSEPMRKEG